MTMRWRTNTATTTTSSLSKQPGESSSSSPSSPLMMEGSSPVFCESSTTASSASTSEVTHPLGEDLLIESSQATAADTTNNTNTTNTSASLSLAHSGSMTTNHKHSSLTAALSSSMDPDGDPPYEAGGGRGGGPLRSSLMDQVHPGHDGNEQHGDTGDDDDDDDDRGGGGEGPVGPAASLEEEDEEEDTPSSSTSSLQTHQQQQQQSSADSTTSTGRILEDDSDDQEIPWKPQATQSTCEFTHTIKDYSQKRDSGCKKAEYSATTVDEFGNRWRLIVYVNGNGRASNHHLSLFLQVADADDLPFGWKKAVSYVLTLEHPNGANLSYAKRNPDKTFKLCPKAIDWGWSQFITSDRIQQEGFVQDDALTVRASVTVKSSSVCIDLEDAELYLKCAVEEGKPEAVQLCLDQGASVNCQFKDDLYTPLHTACSSSTAEEDTPGDGSTTSNNNANNNNTHHAMTHSAGSMKVLKLLLEKGADGNACNKWRETPLLIAANNGHRAAVEALLKHGADPSLCSEAGWSALTFAAHKGYDDIVALLLRAGAPVNCLVTEDSSTPLHKACAGSKAGHLTAVKLLLDNSADVHALNKWRETPLLTAANHGQAGAVDALLKSGADPCKCTDTGWSPLSIAAYKGHDEVVKLLLEEGAPTEEADPTLSALLQAATKGLPGTVELLLKHGADHTVTTKKGDTALSILVEQNLIDAAVEMVTEYKASVPRCSRDRKKVQRARLLINLRVKQLEREGKNVRLEDDDDDDDETDQEDNVEASAQHDDEVAKQSKAPNKKNKKKKKKKMSAEEQAKAAEEALLMELEQEDAEREKQEQDANKKSAKKRKKKERERQQKKEQEEKRMAEQREREEKLRKEREAKEAKASAERDRLAAIKRKEVQEERKRQQQLLEKQRREQQARDAEQRKKEQARKKQEQEKAKAAAAVANNSGPAADKRGKQPAATKGGKRQQAGAPALATGTAKTAGNNATTTSRGLTPGKAGTANKAGASASSRPAAGKNRGWETKPVEKNQTPTKKAVVGLAPPPVGSSSNSVSSGPHYLTPEHSGEINARSMDPFHGTSQTPAPSPFAPAIGGSRGFPQASSTPRYNQSETVAQPPAGARYSQSDSVMNGLPSSPAPFSGMEVPAVALFRRDKVAELLQRCSLSRSSSEALGSVDEQTIKKVLYRWMVRAAHESSAYLDCVIPSWMDFDQLTAFFQRQFISESRKGMSHSGRGPSMVSMESLKEAGSTMARLCHKLAKDVVDFRRRLEEQLPREWSDASIGMSASEVMENGGTSAVLVDWANRSQVYISTQTFASLRERYVDISTRLLSSIFTARIRYDTKQLVVADTSLDFRLPSATQSTLARVASVSAEVWADPFSTLEGNVFWGQCPDVDGVFGGLVPFSKDERGEDLLSRHGGSVSVVPPLDNMVASRYLHRMLELLAAGTKDRVPISFAVFLRADCFLDCHNAPTLNDLYMLDPALRDRSSYLVRVEQLAAGQHSFFCGKSGSMAVSNSGSLFVLLQNEGGRSRFDIRDAALNDIIRSLEGGDVQTNEPQLMTMAFPTSDLVSRKDTSTAVGGGYFESRSAPMSPMQQHSTITPDFSMIGGTTIPTNSAFGAPSTSSGSDFGAPGARRPARGRLFDLVDTGEDDNAMGEAVEDVVSGMLGNLNMDLFQQSNNSNEIDIEAISLMGIGGLPSSSGGLQPRSSRGRFG